MKRQDKLIITCAAVIVAAAFLIAFVTAKSAEAAYVPEPIRDIEDTAVCMATACDDDTVTLEQIESDILLSYFWAIAMKESKCDRWAYNELEDAVSLTQMRPCYVDEVNRILDITNPGAEHFNYFDRWDPDLHLKMFEIYNLYHCPELDLDQVIDHHNPGCSQAYRNQVHQYYNQYINQHE